MLKAKDNLSLMVLSPYRLPVDPERLVTHAARLSGFAFVFFALVFSYKFIESTATEYMVGVVQTAGAAHAVCSDCAERTRTPHVSFAYTALLEANGYEITLSVPHADRVTIYAYQTGTGEYQKLGEAVLTHGSTWKYVWDTEGVVPGNYWFKALVQNEYGLYDRSDSRYLKVE